MALKADSQRDAIAKAQKADLFDLDTSLAAWDAEYADEITGCLVDEVGVEEYENSMWYDRDGQADTELGADISFDLHTQTSEETSRRPNDHRLP